MNELSLELKPEIKTYDIDIAGHVNNVVYIRWLEDLRINIFNNYFKFQDLLSNNLYPVVISTNINYKKYLKLFDRPVCIINVEHFQHGILGLKTVIKRNQEIIAVGRQRCVLLDLKTGRMDKDKLKSILQSQNK